MARRERKVRRPKVIVPLAAMGDIAFQLIIFFIVVGSISKQAVPVELPLVYDIDKVDSTQVVVAIDKDGRYYFNGREVPDEEAIKWGVLAEIERRGGPEVPEAKRIFVHVENSTLRDVYEPFEQAIIEAGGEMVIVAKKPN